MFAVNKLSDVPAGWAGDLTRTGNAIVEPAFFATDEDVEPGRAVAYNEDGKIEYFTDEASQVVIGLTVRSYPAGSGYPESTKIPAGRAVGVLRRGYCLVVCSNGTPAQGNPVYMYKTQNGSHKVGDFSAVEDSTYTVKIPGATWGSSGVSAEKLAEVAVI